MATAAKAVIGHNSPPPIETHKLHIEDLLMEANNWLDGDPILNQAQADEVGKLLTQLREARKGADARRAAEKKPHDDAGKAVQAAWKPLLDRVDLAETTAKKALAPYLAAEDARKRAIADEARAEADRKAAEARAAIEAARDTDLNARADAEELVKEAEKASKAAARLGKDKAQASTGGRAIGLRSVWKATLSEPVEALKHYRAVEPQALKDFLQSLADRDVRAGLRSIPGFQITEEKVAI